MVYSMAARVFKFICTSPIPNVGDFAGIGPRFMRSREKEGRIFGKNIVFIRRGTDSSHRAERNS